MMKKMMKLLVVAMVMAMVAAGCQAVIEDETMPAGDGTDMTSSDIYDESEDDMMEEEMDKSMEDKPHADMDDDMSNDGMDKGDMKEDAMDGMEEDAMEKDGMMDETMMNDGEQAPKFELMDLSGNTVSLEDFAGEKVYVKYWASWCPVCNTGLPDINELSASAEGYKVITIVTPDSYGEKSIDKFKTWFAAKEFDDMTVLLDQDGVYAREFGVRGFPTSAYIGSDGVLIKVLPGHVSNEQIDAAMASFY